MRFQIETEQKTNIIQRQFLQNVTSFMGGTSSFFVCILSILEQKLSFSLHINLKKKKGEILDRN